MDDAPVKKLLYSALLTIQKGNTKSYEQHVIIKEVEQGCKEKKNKKSCNQPAFFTFKNSSGYSFVHF